MSQNSRDKECKRKEIRHLQSEASPPTHVHDSHPLWKFLVIWAVMEVYSVCGDDDTALLSDGVGWIREPKTHIVETSYAFSVT